MGTHRPAQHKVTHLTPLWDHGRRHRLPAHEITSRFHWWVPGDDRGWGGSNFNPLLQPEAVLKLHLDFYSMKRQLMQSLGICYFTDWAPPYPQTRQKYTVQWKRKESAAFTNWNLIQRVRMLLSGRELVTALDVSLGSTTTSTTSKQNKIPKNSNQTKIWSITHVNWQWYCRNLK